MKNDLINRSAAIEQLERREKILGGSCLISTRSFRNFLLNRPAVDDVEVIRCADCAYYGKSPFGHPHIGWCRIDCKHRKPEFFCANGDRK
jgi:hypothetical protein